MRYAILTAIGICAFFISVFLIGGCHSVAPADMTRDECVHELQFCETDSVAEVFAPSPVMPDAIDDRDSVIAGLRAEIERQRDEIDNMNADLLANDIDYRGLLEVSQEFKIAVLDVAVEEADNNCNNGAWSITLCNYYWSEQ